MHTDNMGVKLFFLLFDLLLLNLSVFMVYHFSPIYEYIDLPGGRDLYFLHANICELFAYVLYSKRNYFFYG